MELRHDIRMAVSIVINGNKMYAIKNIFTPDMAIENIIAGRAREDGKR